MVLLSVIIFNFLLALLIVLFNKLTCGICKCSKHLVGKVVIVTGANAGIGYETAKNLAERGARVILACRNEQCGTTARDSIIAHTGNLDVHFKKLDLASFKFVRTFVADVLKTEKRLDILINNAALHGSENVKTEDGLLLGMQVNHFSPFLLTCLLLPLLKSSAPSRILNVSSAAHTRGEIDFENLNMEKETEKTFSVSKVYCVSKLYNVLMTVELARRLRDSGVTAYSINPGMVFTDNWSDFPIAKYFRILIQPFMKNSWEGAQTSIYLTVAPEAEIVSGCYYADCRKKLSSILSNDTELARKLWEVSERLVQLK